MKREPKWLSKELVIAMHRELIRQYGGLYAIRDATLLESALAKPQQKFAYEESATLFDLAASLGYGLTKNHPFGDGNKRIAFAAMGVFMMISGHEINATEVDAVIIMLGVADGSIGEKQLAEWLRKNHTRT
ncbi:MAG: type II toxin-antitoxin system death-on-curing family toxin [Spirochaetota bacterium]